MTKPEHSVIGAAITLLRTAGVADEDIATALGAGIVSIARHNSAGPAWAKLLGELAAAMSATDEGKET